MDKVTKEYIDFVLNAVKRKLSCMNEDEFEEQVKKGEIKFRRYRLLESEKEETNELPRAVTVTIEF